MEIPALIQAQREMRALLLNDPHRPTYHFTAPEGNCMPFDPNGAIFWQGRYHLCYIFQDERGHCWGHASSHDLIHWRWHPPVLFPSPGDVDRGIFSGNCFVNKDGAATMLYHGCEAGNCIATCSEPLLEHWTKLPSNPIVPNPAPDSPEAARYRSWDPHGWVEGDRYYAVFGGNPATIFTADTLDHWSYVGPLLAHDMPDVESCEDISCPDLFPLGDRHVLLCISHTHGCRYYVGEWKDEQFHPEQHRRMNWPGGTCFAPETLLDDRGRRILWTWALEQRSKENAAWGGVMTLPRVLSPAPDHTLYIDPVEELQSLRSNPHTQRDIQLRDGTPVTLDDICGDTLELEITFRPSSARRFGVKVRSSPDGAEETAIICDLDTGQLHIDVANSTLASDVAYQTYVMTFLLPDNDNPRVTVQSAPFTLAPDEPLHLRVFLDRSMLEVFANRRQCITQRIYPTRADSLAIRLFADGGDMTVESLTAWEMAPANAW